MKIIAFYEDQWMPPGTDYAQWDHLARAFKLDGVQLIRSWSEAVVPDGYEVIVADENGDEDSRLFSPPEASALVFGRSAMSISSEVPHSTSIRVAVPGSPTLFGVNAAAIMLRDFEWQSP